MKQYDRRSFLVGAMLAGLFVAGVACGGETGGDPDAEVRVQKYIDTVTPMFEEARTAREALEEETPAPSAASEAADAKRWFDRLISNQEKLVGALGGVGDPGVELKGAHNSYLAALSEFLALNRRIRDRLADAGSDFNMGDFSLDPELGISPQMLLGDRSIEACEELERIGRESVASADLSCAPDR